MLLSKKKKENKEIDIYKPKISGELTERKERSVHYKSRVWLRAQ